MTIQRFDGITIDGARSHGSGVFAAHDWRLMALEPHGAPIIAKANQSSTKTLRSFLSIDHAALTSTLGHYSSVQSINSEDTVTWSVFGATDPTPWLSDLLTVTFGPAIR